MRYATVYARYGVVASVIHGHYSSKQPVREDEGCYLICLVLHSFYSFGGVNFDERGNSIQ